MITGDVLTFAALVVLVLVIAVVGRRKQTIHLPPGVGSAARKDDQSPQ